VKPGVDPKIFTVLAGSAEVRQEMVAGTDAALARGVVGDEIFWGEDRMDFIDEALALA